MAEVALEAMTTMAAAAGMIEVSIVVAISAEVADKTTVEAI